MVARMMAKDPAERYQTPGEIARDLAPFCKAPPKKGPTSRGDTIVFPDTSTKHPPALPKQPPRNGRRRTAVVAAALALPLLLAGIVIAFKWTKKDGSSTELTIQVGAPVGGDGKQKAEAPKNPPAARADGKVAAYPHGDGRWQVEEDELVQANPDAAAAVLTFGDLAWQDYDLTMHVKRVKGYGACIVNFRCEDCANMCQFGLDLAKNITWVSHQVARKHQRLDTDVVWAMDDQWHELAVKLRGQKVECLLDGRVVHSTDKLVYRRGYVWLYVGPNTSLRFKNLKVSDRDGNVLVGGIRDLDLADRPGSAAGKFEDEAKAGTVWKGKLVQSIRDKEVYSAADFEFHVVTRNGMEFTGEYWLEGKTRGVKVEGRIDAKGNVSYVPVQLLGVGRPMLVADQLGKWQVATVKGKEFRCTAVNTKDLTNRGDAMARKQD